MNDQTEMDKTVPGAHAVNLGALTGHMGKLSLTDEKPCINVNSLNLYYGEKQALKDISMVVPEKKGHCIHRSQRLRQIDAAALF